MATPTNGRGVWAVDFGVMGRAGDDDDGAMARGMLSYGLTEDLQLSVSAPLVLASGPFAPARMSAMMPGSGDVEAIGAWRFHRRATGVGRRVETTAYLGAIVPGVQRPTGMAADLARAPGVYTGVATGLASRSHYLWGGVGYVRYAERAGDRRADVVTYSAVWGYRPPALRTDYPRWDWRMFVELTGDRAGRLRRSGVAHDGTGAHQVMLGPTVLGLYRNYAVQGGIQLPVHRNIGSALQRERLRYAVNMSYFF